MSSSPPSEDETTHVTTHEDLLGELNLARGKVSAFLIVLQGANVGETYKLDGELDIGRGSRAAIRLRDEGVSRRHARIYSLDGKFLIEDLKSSNGTLVNGQVVQNKILEDGDKIRLGSTTILKFTFHDNLDETFQQRMYEAALRDGLTKAFNKKYFLDRLDTEFAHAIRRSLPLSLIMFDIDLFKQINDGCGGHPAGDHVLARIAEVSQSILRLDDVFARYGGEEFAVICKGVGLEQAAIVAERLRFRIQHTSIEWQNINLSVTISCGVAALPSLTIPDAETLIARADEALYSSKRNGRNRVSLYREESPTSS